MNHPPTILIVDDTPSARETLEAHLYHENYELHFAENGQQALDMMTQQPYDLVLLDVMMPEMDGFEVCHRLKEQPHWRAIPIILITALNAKQDIVQGLEAGADEFLSKPVNSLELRARVRSMLRIKKQYDDLQALLKLREDLSRMIVHDMRSPLMAISGFSQMLLAEETNLSPEQRKDIDHITQQAQRLNSFINDLLIIAKMESGKFLLNRVTIDLPKLVSEVSERQQVIAKARNVSLTVELPTNKRDWPRLDKNLFQRTLDNLISNALKFSLKNSTVTIRLADRPDLYLEVIDEGPGIPSEYHDRIFDQFEVVRLRQQGISQTGLGLTFCKMVTEAHGGTISVSHNQPRGAIFTIKI